MTCHPFSLHSTLFNFTSSNVIPFSFHFISSHLISFSSLFIQIRWSHLILCNFKSSRYISLDPQLHGRSVFHLHFISFHSISIPCPSHLFLIHSMLFHSIPLHFISSHFITCHLISGQLTFISFYHISYRVAGIYGRGDRKQYGLKPQ